MKHKLFLSVFIILIVLMFTSCIDYVQSITYTNGEYRLYHKVTLSKVLLEFADEDSDEFVSEIIEDTSYDFPDYVTINVVDSETEAGSEFILNINPKEATDEQKKFLPRKSGDKYFIPFYVDELISGTDGFDDMDLDDPYTMMMLSTAKFRIMIAKNVIPSIESAYLQAEDEDDENFFIPVYDYGNIYCLEIPFTLFIEDYLYDLDRIVITR